MTYYLRAADITRVDLFEGHERTSAAGKRIYGGNVRRLDGRDWYHPHEVYEVPAKNLDRVRSIVDEHEYELRKITASDDIEYAHQRDAVSEGFTRRFVTEIRRLVKPVEGSEESRARHAVPDMPGAA